MKKEQAIAKVKEIYPTVRGRRNCVKANAFFEEKGIRRVLTGYVIDKYFVDDKTEEIYVTSKFDVINDIEDFED